MYRCNTSKYAATNARASTLFPAMESAFKTAASTAPHAFATSLAILLSGPNAAAATVYASCFGAAPSWSRVRALDV